MKELQKIVNDINNSTKVKETLIKIDKIAGTIYDYPYKLLIQNRNNGATQGYYTGPQSRVEHFKTLAELRAVITALDLLAISGGLK